MSVQEVALFKRSLAVTATSLTVVCMPTSGSIMLCSCSLFSFKFNFLEIEDRSTADPRISLISKFFCLFLNFTTGIKRLAHKFHRLVLSVTPVESMGESSDDDASIGNTAEENASADNISNENASIINICNVDEAFIGDNDMVSVKPDTTVVRIFGVSR